MVDFQSRDTRRSNEEEESPDESSDEDADQAADAGDAESEDAEHAADDHDHHDHDAGQVSVAILTVSSTRSLDDDPAGDAIADAFERDGHEVVTRELVGDSYDTVQSAVANLVGRGDVDVVVSTGGTGVTPDDVTVDAASTLFDKLLPGFGELFRRLSYDHVGAKVVGTRATAGVVDRTLVFCLPGSENAAKLGSREVIVPEISHLVGLASRE